MMRKLWNDEVGAIISAELVLVMTILGIGMVTGLASVRDAVITELADVGAAIGSVDQSYTVGGVSAHSAATSSSVFADAPDFCDQGNATAGSRCLTINGGVSGAVAGNQEAGS